jgi:hypothetical protein
MDKKKKLLALQRYYIDDVTLARAARDAGIELIDMLEFMRTHDLPIIYDERDVAEGIAKVSSLMEEAGIKSALSMVRESFA